MAKTKKERAMGLAYGMLLQARLFAAIIKRQRCRCGTGANTDGIQCNACIAVQLHYDLDRAVKLWEKAFDKRRTAKGK